MCTIKRSNSVPGPVISNRPVHNMCSAKISNSTPGLKRFYRPDHNMCSTKISNSAPGRQRRCGPWAVNAMRALTLSQILCCCPLFVTSGRHNIDESSALWTANALQRSQIPAYALQLSPMPAYALQLSPMPAYALQRSPKPADALQLSPNPPNAYASTLVSKSPSSGTETTQAQTTYGRATFLRREEADPMTWKTRIEQPSSATASKSLGTIPGRSPTQYYSNLYKRQYLSLSIVRNMKRMVAINKIASEAVPIQRTKRRTRRAQWYSPTRLSLQGPWLHRVAMRGRWLKLYSNLESSYSRPRRSYTLRPREGSKLASSAPMPELQHGYPEAVVRLITQPFRSSLPEKTSGLQTTRGSKALKRKKSDYFNFNDGNREGPVRQRSRPIFGSESSMFPKSGQARRSRSSRDTPDIRRRTISEQSLREDSERELQFLRSMSSFGNSSPEKKETNKPADPPSRDSVNLHAKEVLKPSTGSQFKNIVVVRKGYGFPHHVTDRNNSNTVMPTTPSRLIDHFPQWNPVPTQRFRSPSVTDGPSRFPSIENVLSLSPNPERQLYLLKGELNKYVNGDDVQIMNTQPVNRNLWTISQGPTDVTRYYRPGLVMSSETKNKSATKKDGPLSRSLRDFNYRNLLPVRDSDDRSSRHAPSHDNNLLLSKREDTSTVTSLVTPQVQDASPNIFPSYSPLPKPEIRGKANPLYEYYKTSGDFRGDLSYDGDHKDDYHDTPSGGEPHVLFLQRSPPSDGGGEESSGGSPKNRHQYHQLFYPRLFYHMKYLPSEETRDINENFEGDKPRFDAYEGRYSNSRFTSNNNINDANLYNVDAYESNNAQNAKIIHDDNHQSTNNDYRYYDGNNYVYYEYDIGSSSSSNLNNDGIVGKPVDDSFKNNTADHGFNSRVNSKDVDSTNKQSDNPGELNEDAHSEIEKINNYGTISFSNNTLHPLLNINSDVSTKVFNIYLAHKAFSNMTSNDFNKINTTEESSHSKDLPESLPSNNIINLNVTKIGCFTDNNDGNKTVVDCNNSSNGNNKTSKIPEEVMINKSAAIDLTTTPPPDKGQPSEVVEKFRSPNGVNDPYDIYYNRNMGIIDNNTNVIYNSDIVHPHQQHLQFKHEQQLQQELELRQLQQQNLTNSHQSNSSSNINNSYNHKHHQQHNNKQQHRHQHHHHALLPPSLQLPPPFPTLPIQFRGNDNNKVDLVPSPGGVPLPPLQAPPTQEFPMNVYGDRGGGLRNYFGFGGDYFHRPIWGYWYFWLSLSIAVAAVAGACGYCRQRKMYESSSSQTIGNGAAGSSVNTSNNNNNISSTATTTSLPHFPGLPFFNPRLQGNMPHQIGFPFFPPAESPSLGSASPLYEGPPLPFPPPALYAPLAPPPYSEAARPSYGNTPRGDLGITGRGLYEYYDRRHPNAYYDRYFPPPSTADDTSSSDTTSLLSYRLHRSFSAHLPTRHGPPHGGRRRCDLPPPPPYSEVAAKPELYPVVVMKRASCASTGTINNSGIIYSPSLECTSGITSRQNSDAGPCGSVANGSDDNTLGDANRHGSVISEGRVSGCSGDRASEGSHRSGSLSVGGSGGTPGPSGTTGGRIGTSIQPSKSVNESCSLQHPWMPPYHYYAYRSGSISTPEGSQGSSTGGMTLPHPSGGEWWRGRGRISPLLTSQLASPASSPLPSDMSSPPPTSPPSPPAPTSPSVSPYHVSRRQLQQHQLPSSGRLPTSAQQPSASTSKGAELKDLLRKISQLPGVPTPPPSPAVSVTNSNASSNTPTVVPPPTRSPSPPTSASTPTPGIRSELPGGDRGRGTSKENSGSNSAPMEDFQSHSLKIKAKYRSQKSYFQSLHFPRTRRKSLQYVRSPQSSSSCSSPQPTAQSTKKSTMHSPQTVLQSPRSSNSSSQNLQVFIEETTKICQTNREAGGTEPQSFTQSPQTVLQSPQSPQSQMISWSLSTPNLTVFNAPLMQYPLQQPAALLPPVAYQSPAFAQPNVSLYQPQYPATLFQQPSASAVHPYYGSQRYNQFPYYQQSTPCEVGRDPSQVHQSFSRRHLYSHMNYPYSLNSYQHFSDLQHLANSALTPASAGTSSFLFLDHYPQHVVSPPANLPQLPESEQQGLAGRTQQRVADLLTEAEDEDDHHVYTNVDLPQHKP